MRRSAMVLIEAISLWCPACHGYLPAPDGSSRWTRDELLQVAANGWRWDCPDCGRRLTIPQNVRPDCGRPITHPRSVRTWSTSARSER